jgi:hypothetical protein
MMQAKPTSEQRSIRSSATAAPSYIAQAISLSPARGQSLDLAPKISSSLSSITLYNDNIKQLITSSSWSRNALSELENVDSEATEEGIAPPTQVAKENARRIISSLEYMGLPEPSVYPTERQEVAIYFKCRVSGVLIHCGSKGEGVCFATIAGKNRRARYDDARDLPDEFVREQLRQLLI